MNDRWFNNKCFTSNISNSRIEVYNIILIIWWSICKNPTIWILFSSILGYPNKTISIISILYYVQLVWCHV